MADIRNISANLRELESQGYPVEHLYLGPKMRVEFHGMMREVGDKTLFPLNGKEYEVKNPAQIFAGNVSNYIDGQEEGFYAVMPGGDKVSLLPSSLEDYKPMWL